MFILHFLVDRFDLKLLLTHCIGHIMINSSDGVEKKQCTLVGKHTTLNAPAATTNFLTPGKARN